MRWMKRNSECIILLLFFAGLWVTPAHATEIVAGKVNDFYTGKPLKGVLVTSNGQISITDENGLFVTKTAGTKLVLRAHGYMRAEETIPDSPVNTPYPIRLLPFTPKGLYLSFYGIGYKGIRESALKLIEETELNALVIDVKGDRGMIPYKSAIPLAAEVGGQQIITVREIGELMRSLKARGIYTIARITVFKDNPLALAKPELAIRTQGGSIWRDREDLAWVDPFKKEVWDYNIEIAIEAARHGFDEIQFDYVRFPDTTGLQFSMPNTQENRVKAISGFLTEAKNRLAPHNVFLSADIFGYVCWNLNDTWIGQKLEDLVSSVDYLSPMLYPSGFQFGIPGYRIPVANPQEIVYLSLKRAQERTQLAPTRFRPWLQAFRDYAFDKRYFKDKEIRDQINAAAQFGAGGWMLWNPSNAYSSSGLKKEESFSDREIVSFLSKSHRTVNFQSSQAW
jgi:hypothetical protein